MELQVRSGHGGPRPHEGARLGPELTGSNRDNLDYLLQNILDPGSVVAKASSDATRT